VHPSRFLCGNLNTTINFIFFTFEYYPKCFGFNAISLLYYLRNTMLITFFNIIQLSKISVYQIRKKKAPRRELEVRQNAHFLPSA
jgi:hypothetical protein